MQKIIQQLKKGKNSSALIDQAITILKKNLSSQDINFAHSLRTGLILEQMGADKETIAAGVLHHISENQLFFKDIDKKSEKQTINFLQKVLYLRKLSAFERGYKPKPLKNWQKVFLNERAENLRRMFFAIAKDIRPILVILAGRLDEMRNFLSAYPQDKKMKKAGAAVEILAPLAYGLGMLSVKGELEDRAFPVLYPKEYQWLQKHVKEKYAHHQKHAQKTKPEIAQVLKKANVSFSEVDARAKHYFSLYQKLQRHEMDIDKIYDLMALRIIVQDIETCYQAMGVIHNAYKPLYGRIKDYISSPKPNGYRALHTTVACPQCGEFMEIQIKTPRMHKEAEYGAAAHFGYKEKLPHKAYQHQFFWLDNLRKWQDEIKNPEKIAQHLAVELFKDRIFIATPKQDIISLPKGSTPVDLAYAVHSDIGEHCVGAKINNKMVALDYNLQTGQTVEILTDKNKTPSVKWLRFVKSGKAKAKIRNFLEKAHGISYAKPRQTAIKEKVQKKVSALKNIIPLRRLKGPQILIGGESGIAVKLSKCCKPATGDNISAFITKGEGASIHQAVCRNLREIKQKWPQRIVSAAWKKK